MSDPSATQYLAEIARLQKELARANDDIDEKLDRLEDAGLGAVGLSQQLEDERAHNMTLEEELAQLGRREERRLRRLERARCLKCRSKVDLRGLNRAAEGDER
jgi:chromosome segregation ATPase